MSKVNIGDQITGSHQTGDKRIPSQMITCDQVAWLGDVLDRYAEILRTPRVRISRAAGGARLAAMLEIMEILDLGFSDDSARGNAVAVFPELRMAPK